MGARVLVHGRDPVRARAAVEAIRQAARAEAVEPVVADFSSLHQVRQLAAEVRSRYDRLDVLVHNAGIYLRSRRLTHDGLETTFTVNHLAPFLLTHLLLAWLTRAAPARVVVVSSTTHRGARLDFENLQGEKQYDGYGAYARSKLANVLFAFELAERVRGLGLTANCLHPGVVNTKLLRAGWGSGGVDLEAGAATSVYLASAPEVEGVTGRYFVNRREAEPSPLAHDRGLRHRLWEVSARLTGIEASWPIGAGSAT
jgi:NAD(P)-dependent dehydrogenase (short-subunit alcohol dehydrogenase family)